MKGQYRILSEIMLFAIGVVITSVILFHYQTIQSSVTDFSLEDNLLSVSDLISTAIIKAVESNAIVRIRIPEEVSGHVYLITAKKDSIILTSYENPEINVTKQIFNISQSHNITILGNIITSSSRHLQIRPVDGEVLIEMWRI